MMKKGFLLLFLGLVVFNCKKETNKSSIKTSIEIENPNNFTFNINAIIEEDDTFTLFYLEKNQKSITKKNSVSVSVKGSLESQNIEFKLKDDTLPLRLFLKFKNEKQQQKITFLKAKLSYEEKEFNIEGKRFFQFFSPNENIEYNRENAVAIGKKIDGKYTPAFASRKVLEDKIDFYLYL